MQLYKTSHIIGSPEDGTDSVSTSWQASQTEASKKRTALKKDGFKTTTETVQVPTAKGSLIDWLNKNCAK